MRLSLGHKLFTGFFSSVVILVLLMLLLMRVGLMRGFESHLRQARLDQLQPLSQLLEEEFERSQQWKLPSSSSGLAVVGPGDQVICGDPQALTASSLRLDLHHRGQVVAQLAATPTAMGQSGFLREQFRSLAVLGLLVISLGALAGLVLTEPLRRSLQTLVEGARRLSQGKFATRLSLSSQDELGLLCTHFNQLAATLERGEESRKQWIADVSHELRTPLAVLRAEIEAMQDGIRQPDAEALNLLHQQVAALTALTDDLFQLARSDLGQLHYRMQEVDLWKALQDVTEQFQSRYQKAGLELKLVRESSRLTSIIWGDPDRLRQLLGNFLENSLRYTQAPGRVEVRCQSVGAQWIVSIDDTPPGVSPEAMERLFERFFRVEASRSKQLGGCGLGLAICQNIAQAHNGRLEASPSPLGGLRLQLILPCYPR